MAEGDSKSKLTKIQHSAYLHHNFKSFAGRLPDEVEGRHGLFVYGHSFAKNDAHVLNMIGMERSLIYLSASMAIRPARQNQTIRANVDHIVGLRPQAYPH